MNLIWPFFNQAVSRRLWYNHKIIFIIDPSSNKNEKSPTSKRVSETECMHATRNLQTHGEMA